MNDDARSRLDRPRHRPRALLRALLRLQRRLDLDQLRANPVGRSFSRSISRESRTGRERGTHLLFLLF